MPIQAPKMIFVPLSEHRAPYTLWECDHVKLSLAGLLKTLSESFDSAQDERWSLISLRIFPFMLRLSKRSETFCSNSLVRARQLRFIDLHPTHPAAPVAVC